MTSAREARRIARRLSYSDEDTEKLARSLLRTKLRVYRRTLSDRIEAHNVSATIRVRAPVKEALAAEALAHARQIARSHNDFLTRASLRLREGMEAERLERELRILGRQRRERRAELIAVTEAYGPHADAVAAFYRDAGQDVSFTFGGHPELGDAPPACPICAAIVAGNPWTLEEVISIGTPHLNCRQSWHPDLGGPLPDGFEVGGEPAGIIGGEPLIARAGGRDEAASSVEAMRR